MIDELLKIIALLSNLITIATGIAEFIKHLKG